MKLNTQIQGQGKPMLILHGFLGMGDNWRSVSKNLSEEYEVHTPDMRNHGKSPHSENFTYEIMVEDVKNYIDSHELKKVVLIGHSMGGKIAMQFASKYPEYLSHLIVVDISPKLYQPHHDDILNSLKDLKDSHLSSRKEAEDKLAERITDKGVRLFLLKNLKREEDHTLSLKPNIDVFIKNRYEIGRALPEECHFRGKTLFIKGENSSYIRDKDEKLIAKHFPDYNIKSISKSGHWVHAENPDDFIKTLLSFIK
jgi:pimeloyl-ACP methyl ester carboxylesterase